MEPVSLHVVQLAWSQIMNILSYCVKSEIEDTMLRCGQEALSDLMSSRPPFLPATQTGCHVVSVHLATDRRAGRGFAGSGL